MPVFVGRYFKNSVKASKPPAEAPTPTVIKLAGEELLIVREDEVLGVLEGAEKPATKVA